MDESAGNRVKAGIIVIGAGGHAKVCIELLRSAGGAVDYCIGGVGDSDECIGVPVLKGDENLLRLRGEGYSKAFIAVGANPLRERLAGLAIAQGFQLVSAVSPHAVISPTATLGAGIAVMAGVVINAESTIGDLAIINTGATIDHDCKIGMASHIAPQCGLAGNVTVGRLSFLGIGCKVIPGITIGEKATIGACGVVISDIGKGATAVGNPARVIK